MNSDLAYLGSGKTKTELKFLQEITKSSSNPLLHTSTFEFITSFLLTPKKIGFFTSIGVLLPNFIFSTTITIKLTCKGQDDKLNADTKGLWRTWAMAMTQTCTKQKWERKREIERWANLGLDISYGLWRRSRCDGSWIETERGKKRET